jgi:D-lyxose ketol-isomerase
MKRSEINRLIRYSLDFFDRMQFRLPPWGYWDLEKWKQNREQCTEIFEKQLGWDLTDFGSGNFSGTGLILFTLRNGSPEPGRERGPVSERDENPGKMRGPEPERGERAGKMHGPEPRPEGTSAEKPYAEKIMIVGEGQVTPMHFHWSKMEDIINRGGGNLMIELYPSDENENLAHHTFEVRIDGIPRSLAPGDTVRITPGESITLYQGLYHKFYGEGGSGTVLVGEVSAVNDDHTDNRFLEETGRFYEIE